MQFLRRVPFSSARVWLSAFTVFAAAACDTGRGASKGGNGDGSGGTSMGGQGASGGSSVEGQQSTGGAGGGGESGGPQGEMEAGGNGGIGGVGGMGVVTPLGGEAGTGTGGAPSLGGSGGVGTTGGTGGQPHQGGPDSRVFGPMFEVPSSCKRADGSPMATLECAGRLPLNSGLRIGQSLAPVALSEIYGASVAAPSAVRPTFVIRMRGAPEAAGVKTFFQLTFGDKTKGLFVACTADNVESGWQGRGAAHILGRVEEDGVGSNRGGRNLPSQADCAESNVEEVAVEVDVASEAAPARLTARGGFRTVGSDPVGYPHFVYLFNIDVCEAEGRKLVPCP